MRPPKVALWGCALLALVWASPARAAWNNVFQVCCLGCKQQQQTIAASPITQDCPQPCPQQNCTTRYVQRSCYQPVTTYRTTYYQEPVTTYRTSFFYEPVTSYRYSCRFDPCTCSFQQVATPCTSYRLRQQCCPVTSYLQRSCLQPVTTMQEMRYFVPETTCCQTTTGDPVWSPPAGANVMPGQQGMQGGISSEPPSLNEQRIPGNGGGTMPPMQMPSLDEQRIPGGGARFERNYPASPKPAVPAVPNLRLDRTTSLDDVSLRGQLVSAGQQPLRHAQVLFVSADQDRLRTSATTTADGRFEVGLAEGNWLVYTPGADGKPVFNQKVYVQGSGPRSVLLVSNPR